MIDADELEVTAAADGGGGDSDVIVAAIDG